MISEEAINTFETVLSLGSPALLLLVIIMLIRGDLITKGQHKELEKDRDTWQNIAMEAIDLSMAAISRQEQNKRG